MAISIRIDFALVPDQNDAFLITLWSGLDELNNGLPSFIYGKRKHVWSGAVPATSGRFPTIFLVYNFLRFIRAPALDWIYGGNVSNVQKLIDLNIQNIDKKGEMEGFNIMHPLDVSLTQQERTLRAQIYSDWQKLGWEDQHRQVAMHLRATHCSNPLYMEKAARDQASSGDPMRYWTLLSNSCATMCPPWIQALANLRASSTGAPA